MKIIYIRSVYSLIYENMFTREKSFSTEYDAYVCEVRIDMFEILYIVLIYQRPTFDALHLSEYLVYLIYVDIRYRSAPKPRVGSRNDRVEPGRDSESFSQHMYWLYVYTKFLLSEVRLARDELVRSDRGARI